MRSFFATAVSIGCGLLLGCSAPDERPFRSTTPVLITEVHFDPSPEQGQVEFIEVTNVTEEAAVLSGWQVTGAGRMAMSEGTTLEPGKSMVFCEHEGVFEKTFGNAARIGGVFDGKLRNKGETLRIEDPQGLVADEVEYSPEDTVVQQAAGTGKSLHRVLPPPTSETASRWRSAPPTPGSARIADRRADRS